MAKEAVTVQIFVPGSERKDHVLRGERTTVGLVQVAAVTGTGARDSAQLQHQRLSLPMLELGPVPLHQ